MARILSADGKKNLIGTRLVELRKKHSLSQRDLASRLQLSGYNLDRNVITRIETYQRYVSDIELKGLCQVLSVSPDDLLGLKDQQP